MTHTRPWQTPTVSRPWPIPPAPASDGSLTIHHLTDLHVDYRPWSREELEHLERDVLDARMPAVHGTVITGDIIEADPASDTYAKRWMTSIARCGPSLWAVGNHDLRKRTPPTRAAWEVAYGRPGNTFADWAGWRLVTFAVDSHTWNQPWIVPDATWTWLDQVVRDAPGPVILAQHYPLQEISNTLASPNILEPTGKVAEFISSHPNIVASIAGHMHWEHTDPRSAKFTQVGNRQNFPCLTGVSPMLSLSGLARDQSAQRPSISTFLTFREDQIELRYRMHGPGLWDGPEGLRKTVMDLRTGTIIRSM